jgi:hypothetical protein
MKRASYFVTVDEVSPSFSISDLNNTDGIALVENSIDGVKVMLCNINVKGELVCL